MRFQNTFKNFEEIIKRSYARYEPTLFFNACEAQAKNLVIYLKSITQIESMYSVYNKN